MELKIHRAIYFLYAIATFQIANILFLIFKLLLNLHGHGQVPPLDISTLTDFIAEIILGAFILLGCLAASKFLQRESSVGWGIAIAIFFLTIPTCSLPISIFGLKYLLCENVRNHFVGLCSSSDSLLKPLNFLKVGA